MELVSRDTSEAWGGGAVKGHTIIEKYLCPCGNSFIVTERDTHVGFKQFNAWIVCSNCIQRYKIINPNSRSWSIVLKNSEEEADWMK